MSSVAPHRSGARRQSRVLTALIVALIAVLGWGTWRSPDFWLSAGQRGDRLMADGDFRRAAETYGDPWRIGVARYRHGDFEAAARTFARVPGAVGAFNAGNAWLMHGRYDEAIKAYDRALSFRPDWPAASDNRALARARKQRLDESGRDRDQESADAYEPDDIVFDPQGEDRAGEDEPRDMNGETLSDAELRATWLRRVQTTPRDFLRAKFAYQAARDDRPANDSGDGTP